MFYFTRNLERQKLRFQKERENYNVDADANVNANADAEMPIPRFPNSPIFYFETKRLKNILKEN